jgi:hypothetical protein
VLVGTGDWAGTDPATRDLLDVILDDGDADPSAAALLEALIDTVAQAPLAGVSLALHLRASERRDVAAGLLAESALYSALQAGPEFAAWRRARPRGFRPLAPGPTVTAQRVGDELTITLRRPEVRNALSATLRDELLDALATAQADPSLTVTLLGEGPDFCAGGDLDEFGTAPDPATAHLVRVQRSIGAVLAELADRTTAVLHGACYGSGIELPAFAGHVVARPDTTIALPELGLGLIPGAGGTVSLPARIGRHRTALLALSRQPIGATQALEWGLVDEIAEPLV